MENYEMPALDVILKSQIEHQVSKYISIFLVLLSTTLFQPIIGFGQDICHPEGNLVIFSNYDGGVLNIDCDIDIPNLVIGVVSYEPVTVNISGAYVDDVVGVIFGGFNEATVNGVDPSIVEIYSTTGGNIPIANYLGNELDFVGVPLVNCITSGSGCFDDTNDGGGGNSSNQIVQWFYSEFGPGTVLFSHTTQYDAWLGANTYVMSQGGNCCLELPTTGLNPIYVQGNTYDFIPYDEIQLCDENIVIDLSGYPVLFQPPIYTGYVWSNGTNGPILTITEPGTYSFYVSDYCHYEESTWLTDTLVVLPCCDAPPTPEGIGFAGCVGDPVTLTATPLSGGTINWYSDAETATLVQTGAGYSPVLAVGTYTFYITETLNGCESETVAVVAEITSAETPVVVGQNTICEGSSVTLTSNVANVLWSNGTSGQEIVVSDPGIYTATNTDLNGCEATSLPFEVNFGTIPLPTISGDTLICFGGTGTLTASGGDTYLWNTGESSQTITVAPLIFGVYTVTAFEGNCSATSDDFLVEVAATSFSLEAMPDVEIAYGDSVQIGVLTLGAVEWDPANTLSCSDCWFPWASPSLTTSYVVVSTDYATGCTFSDTITVTVDPEIQIFAPIAFTPNDDGVNDVFQIVGPNLIDPIFRVFNRWGEEIYTSTDSHPIWIGGKDKYYANNDAFVWTLEFSTPNGREFRKGHVVMIR
jgi:gliding motility-associated-like protein